MNKNANKAQKAIRSANLDIWESRYLVGARDMKRSAKRASKRASRREAKAQIRTEAPPKN